MDMAGVGEERMLWVFCFSFLPLHLPGHGVCGVQGQEVIFQMRNLYGNIIVV